MKGSDALKEKELILSGKGKGNSVKAGLLFCFLFLFFLYFCPRGVPRQDIGWWMDLPWGLKRPELHGKSENLEKKEPRNE